MAERQRGRPKMAGKRRNRLRQITVTMPDEFRDQFQAYLDAHHVGFSEWIRSKMREALEAEEQKDGDTDE